jgi:lipopolysaccharide export system permease protein
MTKIIDRLLTRGYFKSYFGCLTALLSLYVVVDLFTNLEAFTRKPGLRSALEHIGNYYSAHIPVIFDRLSEAIVLLAAMFTIALMQRNNEQVPLLSAGVSTRRIVLPILMSAFVMLTVAILNQEMLIPRIAGQLAKDRDDPEGDKFLPVKGGYEANKIHITGERAVRKDMIVYKFVCVLPEGLGDHLHLQAEEARYIPPGRGQRCGGWELLKALPADKVEPIPNILDVLDTGHYFLHTREVDFDTVTRNPNWFNTVSTWNLFSELNKSDARGSAAVAVLFHTRLTRPLLGMVLVLMGLSVILRDQNRNVFISSGMCLVLCAVFFAACYMSKTAGDYEYVSPATAAWAPVVVFGPFAIVLFDAVHT